jgi:Zn-dependent M28 family amino/carboxypeptidase
MNVIVAGYVLSQAKQECGTPFAAVTFNGFNFPSNGYDSVPSLALQSAMLRPRVSALAVLVLFSSLLPAQIRPALANHIRAEMNFLASDALRGRGSATHDEFVAATYVVSQFQSFGLQNAHLQSIELPSGQMTYNAYAMLRGSDPVLSAQTILLSAHLDHLGYRPNLHGSDSIFYGADDDASGTTAVLELARSFASAPHRPRRTVVFVCFGSEETGGQGNEYFMANPPAPLSSIVANLEFEMIGHSDPSLAPHQLFLTGWERTDLGPTLATHGAPLVADPHIKGQFFQRSDNFALAQRGIVAQTVSSYGLGKHYHTPADDLAHIDFEHLATAIQSMIPSVRWLANTDWKPAWNPGGRP